MIFLDDFPFFFLSSERMTLARLIITHSSDEAELDWAKCTLSFLDIFEA